MKNNDAKMQEHQELREKLTDAIKSGDDNAFVEALDALVEQIGAELREEYDELAAQHDDRVLAARGVRQLTQAEKKYYKALAEAFEAKNPKEALANTDAIFPLTVFDAVFEELTTDHPLLNAIDFTPSTASYKVIYSESGEQVALWGELTDAIVKELMAGFKTADGLLAKLSAFIPVASSLIDLGPEWLDRLVRAILVEAIANGLEVGIVDGTGKKMPIGMTRQVGDGVTVTDGVYPKKEIIKVDSFDVQTYGKLAALLATDASGKPRKINGNLLLIVNPKDYFSKIIPATTMMTADGKFVRDVFPIPTDAVQSIAVPVGEAVIGIPKRYLALLGMGINKSGKVEFSDDYQFLEDKRVYRVKVYATGLPKDNNAFIRLDISDLRPLFYRVQSVAAAEASTDATLSALRLGSAALSPAFAANTVTYTASTTNATNTINATPSNAAAEIEVELNGTVVPNGSALAWNSGSNTVTVKVTAEDGETTKTYTVTVTKS